MKQETKIRLLYTGKMVFVAAIVLFCGMYYYKKVYAAGYVENNIGSVAKEDTPLINAIEEMDIPTVEQLIHQGADVNERVPDFGMPLITVVVFNGNKDAVVPMVDALLALGADPSLQDDQGLIGLHWLTNVTNDREKQEVARSLLSYNAPINLQDFKGNTPLHRIAEAPQIGLAIHLIKQYGPMIDFTIKNNNGDSVIEVCNKSDIKSFLDTYLKNREQQFGDNQPNKRDQFGRTGLMLALMRNDEPFVLDQLKNDKADPNAQEENRYGNRPLHFACMRRFNVKPYIALLLQYGANPMLTNKDGKKPIDMINFITDNAERAAVKQLLLSAMHT